MPSRIDEVLRWVKGTKVLDVGCTGQRQFRADTSSEWWLHGRLLQQIPDTWGIDSSEKNVSELAAAGIPNLHVADAHDFSLGVQFDTIVAGEVIEHLADPGRFLRNVKRNLAPGGRIVLTTPYAFCFAYALYAWLKFPKTCSNPEHTMWFCPETMHVLVERSGLKVRAWRLVEDRRPDLPSKAYRLMFQVLRVFGWMIPERALANTMVFVLEAEEGPHCD